MSEDNLAEQAVYPDDDQNYIADPDHTLQELESELVGPPQGLGFGIDLTRLGKKMDYQDEFMAHFDEFSESWRQMLKKDKRF